MAEKKEPTRCDICGCTEEEGACVIEKIQGKNVCHKFYYDAEAEVES